MRWLAALCLPPVGALVTVRLLWPDLSRCVVYGPLGGVMLFGSFVLRVAAVTVVNAGVVLTVALVGSARLRGL